MAITSYDGIINEITVNDQYDEWFFYKQPGISSEAAGVWHSLWFVEGIPAAESAPSGTPGDQHEDEGIYFADQASDKKIILTLEGHATRDCVLMLYDRLVSVDFDAASGTGDKTINSASLPRYSGADAKNVQAWVEFRGAGSGTPTLALASYTNEDGTTGRAGPQMNTSSTPAANSMFRLGLQAGDRGVRSVETINVGSASTGASTNLVLLRRLAMMSLPSNVANGEDMILQMPSLPRVYDGASLGLAYMPTSSASSLEFHGKLRIFWG